MSVLKSSLVKGAVAALAGAMLVTTAASADVVCNQWRECWHVRDHYTYPPGIGFFMHSDDWAARHRDDWRWRRDRDDRGYYNRAGVWITF